MKQESPTSLDIGIQQQKSFINAPKEVTKNNNSVKNEKVGNDIKVNNDDNDNSQTIDKKLSEVHPMEIKKEVEIKNIVTNGNDQNFVDNNNSKSNNVNINNNKEFDDMPNKELLSKLSETLAEFYGGGNDNDGIKEPQKKRPRSCAKDGERVDTVNNTFPEIKIRDFAFPIDDPRHWGQIIPEEEEEEEDNEYMNRRARALYDFTAENSSELSFQEGDILLVQNRQYDGWLMASLGEETGLVPENYVKILGEDEEDEDEYGNWAEEGNNDE
ncbi:hypothetical protein C1645_756964 [Glomus cerebriforme]|uniref:SH3 domain-containing protein n=1 Tax=Glomus cerebriforme TaxID=658196 RepID=A0A397TEA2_9GLOM|nr:hypothetical protein C1645_756964 [Glomus cerebriforme]